MLSTAFGLLLHQHSSRCSLWTGAGCSLKPASEIRLGPKRNVHDVPHRRVVVSDEGIVRCVLEEQEFQGEGRKKADAKKDAAANALAFLQEQPLWEAQHRLPPLQDVLKACFTNQVHGLTVPFFLFPVTQRTGSERSTSGHQDTLSAPSLPKPIHGVTLIV